MGTRAHEHRERTGGGRPGSETAQPSTTWGLVCGPVYVAPRPPGLLAPPQGCTAIVPIVRRHDQGRTPAVAVTARLKPVTAAATPMVVPVVTTSSMSTAVRSAERIATNRG